MSSWHLSGLVVRQSDGYEGKQTQELLCEQGAPSDNRVGQHVHQLP